MIARLRNRHPQMLGWVGAVACLGFVAALALRPGPAFVSSTLPRDTSSWSVVGAPGGVLALRERESGREWVSLERPSGLSSPDLLVYWAPTAGDESTLPAEAVLLGPLGDPGVRRFELPQAETSGILIVYSLGHDRIEMTEPLISIRLEDHGP